ncbi:hypothetical protein K1567_27165 [Pseudomonas sp. S5F11]|jgi:hypothetical protein|uniref:hypothetical protein n=1 Tax=Pseudomonas sp. S5F11 TaxID=2866385 RepID=UPI001C7D6AB5|nr:hypothetical protein [Pseudomonas sp. S5F11]MBX4139570.1 hypothetical protein [Pseudomonas sp. S5F11]
MPMIETDQLKPASDAAQSAKQAWYAAVEVMNAHDKADIEGLALATERVVMAREVYNDLCRDLARDVHMLLNAAHSE